MNNLQKFVPYGWWSNNRELSLANVRPPIRLMRKLQSILKDSDLWVFMQSDGEWFLATMGTNNQYVEGYINDVSFSFMHRKRILIPQITLRKLDGSAVMGREIESAEIQQEIIKTCVEASFKLRGERTVIMDIAESQQKKIKDNLYTSRDEIKQGIKSLPWHVVKQYKDDYGTGTSTRAERIAAEKKDRAQLERKEQKLLFSSEKIRKFAATKLKD